MAGYGEVLGLLDQQHEGPLLPPLLPPLLLGRHVLQGQDEVAAGVEDSLVLRGLRLGTWERTISMPVLRIRIQIARLDPDPYSESGSWK